MIEVEFLTAAEVELAEAVEYYNQLLPGLGESFFSEFISAIERIRQHPEAWQKFSDRTRRCLMNRFPFGVVYQLRGDLVLVVAVANLHRHPEYWRNR